MMACSTCVGYHAEKRSIRQNRIKPTQCAAADVQSPVCRFQPRKAEERAELPAGGSETGEMPHPFTAVAAVHAQ